MQLASITPSKINLAAPRKKSQDVTSRRNMINRTPIKRDVEEPVQNRSIFGNKFASKNLRIHHKRNLERIQALNKKVEDYNQDPS